MRERIRFWIAVFHDLWMLFQMWLFMVIWDLYCWWNDINNREDDDARPKR